ncbi:hypothetical protein PVAND_001030 [Polypedilum vanderplanki]|uniref:Dynein-1, subspecies f n=1 Tax=Polypedilum vanderplanki TaxID=319348 RepID=A0A9J6BMB4_POLVA|nr:hypothetical protein PVAND_001030 [Polypedilum vanderplanki]
MADYRIIWLRDRISKALGVQDHPETIEELFREHSEKFQNYLDEEISSVDEMEKCAIYIYRTFYDKLVEREVLTIEKVPRIMTPPQQVTIDISKEKKGRKGKARRAAKGDSREEGGEVRPDPDIEDEEIKETTRSAPEKKRGGKSRRRRTAVEEDEQEGETPEPPKEQLYSFIEVRKIEQSFEKTPILHAVFSMKELEEIDHKGCFVYFIRKSMLPIPHMDCLDDAMSDMPDYFIIGTLVGSFIHKLLSQSKTILREVVSMQMRVPIINEKNDIHMAIEARTNEGEQKIGLIDFSRPSDYRTKAIEARNAGINVGDDTSHLSGTSRLSTVATSNDSLKTGGAYEPYEEPTPQSHDDKWNQLYTKAELEAQKERAQSQNVPIKKPSTVEILQNNLDKFEQTVEWTIDHVICTFNLPTEYNALGQEHVIDDEDKVKIKVDPLKMSLDGIEISQLEEIVDGWFKHVSKIIRDACEKEPNNPTPIAEYELWIEREREFNHLMEQLKSPFAEMIFDKLKAENSKALDNWPPLMKKLQSERDLAQENAEYLSTLQEFFIKIRDEDNFSFIISIIPSMMNGLRHIWTMSNNYSNDENMLNLLSKISNIFTIKVMQIVDLEKIFSLSATAAYKRARECVNLLQCWKSSYMETRAFIENSGVGSRWEFDKKILFGLVDHITRICQDISEIAKSFYEFENMFSYRLRSNVADPEDVDLMIKKVYRLLNHILSIDYNIFEPNNFDNWESTLDYFYKQMEIVENEARVVLDQCIDSLKSAEQGLELISYMGEVETREKLLNHLMSKRESVMKKFVTEVGIVEHEFLKFRKNPPLQRNQNKYSGAVFWERLLMEKLKKSVIAFRSMEQTDDDNDECNFLKRSAFNQYFAIAQEMAAFEKDLFARFLHEGTFVVNNVLKRNILKLKFMTLPEELKDDSIRKEGMPQSMSLAKTVSKTGRVKAHSQKLKLASSQGALSAITPRKSQSVKSKFNIYSTAIQWMTNRPLSDNPDLALAEKLMKASESFVGDKKSSKSARHDFKVSQAKLMTTASQQQKVPTWREIVGSSLLVEYELKFDVNFSQQIFDVMIEGQQFEYLGFTLNPVIRMAIMRKEQLSSDVEYVKRIVNEYNDIVAKLSPSEIHFLRDKLYETESKIQAGLGRYTWQTLNIKTFCESCERLLKNLSAIVMQINRMAKNIHGKVSELESFSLFVIDKHEQKSSVSNLRPPIILKSSKLDGKMSETPDDLEEIEAIGERKKSVRITERDLSVKSCLEYFSSLELERNEKTSKLQRLYDSIGPTMIKLESLILGTFTGESDKMNHYYTYWEREMFSALVRFTTRNLQNFSEKLMHNDVMFEVDAVLAAPEITMKPSANEIYNIMVHSVKDFLERLKCFRRWMSETCLPCPPTRLDNNEVYVFSFYEDIVQIPKVCELVINLQQTIQNLVSDVRSYLSRWHKYKSLWMYDKNVVCDKYLNRRVPLVRLDEKFIFFTQIINDLESVKPYYDIKSIRINLQPLIRSIIEHAVEWRNTLGNFLSERTSVDMVTMNKEFKELRLNLDRNIKHLSDFKIVMSTINVIQSTTLTVELKIKEMQETFNVLEEHRIHFPYGDMLMAFHLEKRWKKLYNSALYRMKTLHSTKVKFSQMTQKDIEKFKNELDEFVNKFDNEGPGIEKDMDKGQKLMEIYAVDFDKMEMNRIEMVNAEKLFDIEVADYSRFLQAKAEFERMQVIFKLYQAQKIARESWGKTLWANLNTQALTDGIDSFMRDYRKLPKVVRQMPIANVLETIMKQFKNVVPLMASLKHEAMRERHWKMLMLRTGKSFDMSPQRFTLNNMFSMELHKHQDVVEEIVLNAIRELAIERGVKEIAQQWETIKFNVIKHTMNESAIDRGYILGSMDEIMQILDDHSMNLQSMSASPFIGPFLTAVQKWEKCLTLVSEIIDEWLAVQRKWIYLEGIFIGGDIRDQLPEEAKKFDDIDKNFRKIMNITAEKLIVIDVCMEPERLAEIRALSEGLDRCQKSLNDYLDSKRRIFPRFYFISTEELLSILGNSRHDCVQEHMIKMFDNIKSLTFAKSAMGLNVAIAMNSSEGETMQFKNQVQAEGRVEEWMNEVLKEMRSSNRHITKKSIFDYGKNKDMSRPDWIMMYQGMICLAANQIWWTSEVEEVFQRVAKGNKRAMKEYLEIQNRQIDDLVRKVRENLSMNDRMKFKTIATIDVHARDIIETFVRDSVLDASEFQWESQLRFYWMKDVDNLYVVQCTGKFEYGYEYMGLNGRLVITPLTDRIYLTITQALTLKMGCAPSGPAGTGKTETTKDLAKAMALLCMVTNCGEGMDNRAVATILSGLSQCGAWGCFDEFNRIDLSVLSVISAQLQTIRSALLANKDKFMFEGQQINLDSKVGIFITMNPGYAGRTELPESIKALFRPVTCIMPDLELICLISLFSDGFLAAKVLAKKMTVLYKLAREQLSKQYHYDFGLRSLNSVLRMAGVVKREMPDAPEAVVLMRVLRDMNFPKFVFEDVPLFLGLIKDLFPGVECPRSVYSQLNDVVRKELQDDGFILKAEQVDKVIQLYETMLTRHCVMIVGPTGGGKSVVLNTLIKAQSAMGIPTKCVTLNPKACSVIELYGYLDASTRDWIDGLFSNIFREMNKVSTTDDDQQQQQQQQRQYVCFDGDVDALWIENMNSVMDDNKLLTLANGERIRLSQNCALLFEVGDLAYASPATVSRAGMVYVDPKNLGYSPYWQRWLMTRHEREREKIHELYERLISDALAFVLEGIDGTTQAQVEPLKMIVPQTELNLIVQLCMMLDATLPQLNDKIIYDDEVLECAFVQCIYFSLGASLMDDSRIRFDAFMKKLNPLMAVQDSIERPANTTQCPTAKSTLYEYFFDIYRREWIAWEWIIPDYIHDVSAKFNDILVPTVDTLRTEWLLNMMNQIQHPIVLVGETGTSKTAIISNFLRNIDQKYNIVLNINFSSRTTSMDVQRTIEAAVEKRTKNIFGPPVGKKLIAFIDDMNMPKVDEYGTQQPIALLKLLFERGGMYGRGKELFWKNFKDISFLAAMGKSGGGRNEVDARFISKFAVINLQFPLESTLKHIYGSILDGHLKLFPEKVQEVSEVVVQMTLDLFKIVTNELPPTPSKFHYIFNMKDLSRIYAGILLTSGANFNSDRQLVRVWRNEFTRVFCDRMICESDVAMVRDHMHEMVNKYFKGDDLRSRMSQISSFRSSDKMEKKDSVSDMPANQYIMRDPLLFGDFRHGVVDEEERTYEDLLDFTACMHLFKEIMDEYNDKRGSMDLVLFDDCLDHLTRVHRVMRMHKGHLLLVGVGGSGKHSISRLAAFAAGCEMFEITITRGYNEESFKADLKTLFNKLMTQPTVFLFSSAQIVEEGFLEFINNILTIGFVPALFTDDEKDSIIGNCRNAAKDAGYASSKDGIWKYFVDKCSENLHVVLSMSPSGDSLRNYCRSFPGLVGNTTINWIFPWPKQALRSVARGYISENRKIPDSYKDEINDHVVHVHESLTYYTQEFHTILRRRNYITPKHYLDYVTTYIRLLDEKSSFITKQIVRYSDGIRKIDDASLQIAILQSEVEKTKMEATKASEDCDRVMEDIEDSTERVMRKKKEAMEKSTEVEQNRKQIAVETEEAEESLRQAMPDLENAREALDTLAKKDITEVRSFANPPEPVQIICECVAILKGNKDISWKTAKGMLAEVNFLKSLQEMNCDLITVKQVTSCRAHMKKTTKMDEMKAISKAGYGLLKFVRAVLRYCDTYREVKPKQERVEFLENDLKQKTKVLEYLKLEVETNEKELEELNKKYEDSKELRQKYREELDISEKRLNAANKLVTGLYSEKNRWQEMLRQLAVDKENMIGTCLLSASFLAYAGAFSWDFRKTMIFDDWLADILRRDIPVTTPYKIDQDLTNDVEMSTWSSEGLPSDDLSIQNGILTTRASRFPFCIDPQQQALNWIRKREFHNNLKILSFNDADFLRHLEISVKYGTPVLFQDVEDYIDPVIGNLLERNFRYQTGQAYVMLGDKEVDVDANFRLYLTTKLSNPQLDPSIYARALVINYAITIDGLENQLLAEVIKVERSDLEEQREMLIEETSINKILLSTLEDSLLRELGSSQGNMLDNEELIQTLESSKSKATEVTTKLELATETAKDINNLRNGYRPVACRGAHLFFVLADMSIVNAMYQYSLSSYLVEFINSLKQADSDIILSKRLVNILKVLTKNIYDYGCSGIFEKHKLLFSFQIASKLQQSEGKLTQAELDFFIKGSMSLEKSSEPCPAKWLNEKSWNDLLHLAATFADSFEHIPQHFKMHMAEWRDWYDLEAPETCECPGGFTSHMTSFQRMMLLRCFRVDRIFCAINSYVIEIMGEEFVTPPVINFKAIYEHTTPFVPVVFMLSPGSDPTGDLIKLAEQHRMIEENRFKYISLGQGQEAAALSLFEIAFNDGHWLMLQNGHLLIKFMKRIEKMLEKIDKPPHKDFRLWITTDPTPIFPIGILQKSLKVVTEPPNGLKLNLRSTFFKMQAEVLQSCQHESFKSLVYVLAFFHAVVLERRKYGKLGFNISYDFNESDFNVCTQILDTYLSRTENIPWNSLKYLIGEVMYGGRVIDDFDRRIVRVYMDEYMGDFLFDTFQPFHFYHDDNVDYKIPSYAKTKEDFIASTDLLPLANTPEVFGLHPNAEINYYSQTTREIWSHLIELQPQTGQSFSGTSRDQFIDNVAEDILRRLPRPFEIWRIKKSFAMNITPTLVVLIQELERFNRLVNRMHVTLSLLRKALAGEIGMDATLDGIANALFNNQLPDDWRKLAPDTTKSLASWMEHLNHRSQQYRYWSSSGEPLVMWLSGLHVPESFLTALVQIACRKNNWPLDRSTLFTVITDFNDPDDVEDRPESGCYVHGLFLEGARIKDRCLDRSLPKVLVEPLPILSIQPIEAHRLKLQNTFRTPVYITSKRRNAMGNGLVFEADLATNIHPNRWVLQGVCLMLNDD